MSDYNALCPTNSIQENTRICCKIDVLFLSCFSEKIYFVVFVVFVVSA